jgi:hypothetical protein
MRKLPEITWMLVVVPASIKARRSHLVALENVFLRVLVVVKSVFVAHKSYAINVQIVRLHTKLINCVM